MSERRRLVGVQAAAVALLVLLVYLTLLRPEGTSDLEGIEAPGGGTNVEAPPRDRDNNGSPGPNGPEGPTGPGGGARGTVVAGSGVAGPGGGGTDTTTLTGTTPSDDQYTDSVTSLIRKVATGGGIPGE